MTPLIAEGVASVDASCQDQITLQSSSIPNGTYVLLRIGLIAHSTVNTFGDGSSAQVGSTAYCHVHYLTQDYNTETLNYISRADGSGASLAITSSAPAGATISFNQSLSASASASSYVGPGYSLLAKPPLSTALADASDTAHFYLDVLDTGASLSSVSGHDYSSPNPNPALALRVSGGTNLVFNASTLPRQTCVLQASSDLVHWSDSTTNSADDNGALTIRLPFSSAGSSDYFRLRSN